MENRLRVAKGEEPAKTLEEIDDEREAAEEEELDQDDALLRESGQILLDYVTLAKHLPLQERVDATTASIDDVTTGATAELN